MKLRTQILVFGLTGAVFACMVGGIGLLSSSRLGDALGRAVLGGQALQASQSADMMHDAIRGDAQLALLGALESDTQRIALAEKGLKEHRATFDAALATLGTLPLDTTGEKALAAARTAAQPYFEAAARVVAASRQDATATKAGMAALQVAFTDLETRVAALSDAIQGSSSVLNVEAQASVARTQLAIGIALAVAIVTLVLLAFWLAGRMARPMQHAVGVAERLAEGDLTARIEPTGNDETRQLLQSMARMQSSFGGIVRNVQEGADSVATASSQISQGNNDLSSRTEEQASALQQTAASMKELATTVEQNATNAQQGNELAVAASTVAARGGEVVGQVVETMKGINDSSRKIADIISVIDGIAFQTNILALNAAVEAARAGEQGRGFAVVASEVRSLAQRSADAAKEIKGLIDASVERVGQGSQLVDQAGVTMDEVVQSIRKVTDLMGEISAASREQSAGVAQIGEAVNQMDQATQQNAALVEESAAAADSLKTQAQQLVGAVAVFRLEAGHQASNAHVRPAGAAAPAAGNVVKPAFKRAAPAAKPQPQAAPLPARTGTDDDWQSF
jgi:methyl-accepting chemotaxis protein